MCHTLTSLNDDRILLVGGREAPNAAKKAAPGKRRKTAKDFPAAEAIMGRLLNGAPTKRVGIRPDGKAPAREGTEITDKTGRVIGRITSGGFGPTLNAPVAMGYLPTSFAAPGAIVFAEVRGQRLGVRIAPMPFVPNTYKR